MTPPIAAQSSELAAGLRRWVTKNAAFTLILAVVLFLCAGRLDWLGGWIYLVVVALTLVANAVFLSPELRAERSQLQEGTKQWDVLLASGMAFWGPMLLYVVAGLDQRFRWSADVPAWLALLAALIGLVGSLFTTWAMRANPFFASTVRIQTERGHEVATSGPYRYVRHPGYLGTIVHFLATPLILGSLWAYLPALLVLAITVTRTALEDRTLQAELAGYPEYAQRIRYRLLPGVW